MSPSEAGRLTHETGMVVVGERHGTNEFPSLVLELAMAAAHVGRLVVAIELGIDAREPTTAYVRSAGTLAERERLLATGSWQRRDGRASKAMFSLVDGLRRCVQAGASIGVDAFDAGPTGDPLSGSYQVEREHLLAERLLEIRSQGATLALTGNVHAELLPRPGAPNEFVPAAALVAEHTPLVSLEGRHAGGHSWCSLLIDGELVSTAHPVAGQDQGATAFVEVGPPSRTRRGVAYVGRITPSPPAVE